MEISVEAVHSNYNLDIKSGKFGLRQNVNLDGWKRGKSEKQGEREREIKIKTVLSLNWIIKIYYHPLAKK